MFDELLEGSWKYSNSITYSYKHTIENDVRIGALQKHSTTATSHTLLLGTDLLYNMDCQIISLRKMRMY